MFHSIASILLENPLFLILHLLHNAAPDIYRELVQGGKTTLWHGQVEWGLCECVCRYVQWKEKVTKNSISLAGVSPIYKNVSKQERVREMEGVSLAEIHVSEVNGSSEV